MGQSSAIIVDFRYVAECDICCQWCVSTSDKEHDGDDSKRGRLTPRGSTGVENLGQITDFLPPL